MLFCCRTREPCDKW